MLDFYLWQPEHNRFSYEHAGVLLKAVSLRNGVEELSIRSSRKGD